MAPEGIRDAKCENPSAVRSVMFAPPRPKLIRFNQATLSLGTLGGNDKTMGLSAKVSVRRLKAAFAEGIHRRRKVTTEWTLNRVVV
jgi:hypothetical protein